MQLRCAFVLQTPITNFSFPFAPLVDWFPEADVLKKRDTLRQLVLSLQSRLNPGLQCDLQQGAVPAAPVIPETSVSDMSVSDMCINSAEDAAVLNAVAATSDANSDSLLQTNSEQCDTDEHKLLEVSVNHISVPVLPVQDCFPKDDVNDNDKSTPAMADDAEMAESVTAQTVPASTSVVGDNSLGVSTLTSSELPLCLTLSSRNSEMIEATVSDEVCHGATISTCSFAAMTLQDRSDHSVVLPVTNCGHLASEQTGSLPVAEAEPIALSTEFTVATEKPSTAVGSGNGVCRVCIVSRVNESELQNSSCESADR